MLYKYFLPGYGLSFHILSYFLREDFDVDEVHFIDYSIKICACWIIFRSLQTQSH